VRILTDGTGRIDPLDAVRIEKAVTSKLRAAIKGPTVEGVPDMDHVSDLLFTVDLTNDVKTTRNRSSIPCRSFRRSRSRVKPPPWV
jgi:hypothetical protein